jgi:hypothetical protein
MQKEASDKLLGSKGHYSDFIISFPVPVSEGDLTIINGEDAVV